MFNHIKINKKLVYGFVALCLAFGLVFSMSAFKVQTLKTPVLYEYVSNSPLSADIKDIANWEVADLQQPSCGEEGALVCRYEFDGDMVDFQSYLENPGTTATAINDNAVNKKQ